MRIYSWNVNSLRSCEEDFLQFISDYQPDIVFIQELRAHPDQLSFFLKSVPGYMYFFNDSGRPGYSGTGVYYNDSLPVTEVSRSVNNEILDLEGRVIYLNVNDVHLYNFYTPNGASSEERQKLKFAYYDEILKLVRSLNEVDAKVIVGGDLNVGHTPLDVYIKNCNESGCLPEERKWFDEMLKVGFIDSFRMFITEGGHYTWWNLRDAKRLLNRGWRFDYFLVSKNMMESIKGAGVLRNVFGSDHCPIWVEIGT